MQTTHLPHERLQPARTFAALRSLVCVLLAATCTLQLGCRANNRYDSIEAELRTRERELADTKAALDQTRNLLHAYEASQRPVPATGPQPSGTVLPLKEISLGRGTGGVDEDGLPGDEGLMVVIVPKDEDGSSIKVPGRVLIAAWEITPAGLKNPIGSWDIGAEKLRRTWKSGLISTGYFVPVPWQTPPSLDRVRVAVRMVTADGRAYEADRDVTVRPPLANRGGNGNVLPYPQPAIPGIAPPSVRPPAFPELPPPSGLEPLPPGVEELPFPKTTTSERGARLLPPVKP
jgi:hypothetical protein